MHPICQCVFYDVKYNIYIIIIPKPEKFQIPKLSQSQEFWVRKRVTEFFHSCGMPVQLSWAVTSLFLISYSYLCCSQSWVNNMYIAAQIWEWVAYNSSPTTHRWRISYLISDAWGVTDEKTWGILSYFRNWLSICRAPC